MRRMAKAMALGLTLVAASCARLSVPLPEGFAELRRDSGRATYQAVSPEGMVYRVRVLANEPRKELRFWSEALRSHLTREGYLPAGEARTLAGGGGASAAPGVLYEWVLPYGNESYLYLTGLLVQGDSIVLAEAGAPQAVYARYRRALAASLAAIRLR